MRLPEELRHAIDLQMEALPASAIARAAAELSHAYNAAQFSIPPVETGAHRLAYLQVRMPATYAACRHVFAKLREQLPDFQPRSLLDLGAGPGTASWAAVDAFPTLANINLVERDAELVRVGQELVSQASHPALKDSTWLNADLRTFSPPPHDLVVLSYAIGELNSTDARRLVQVCLSSAQVFVLIEPGTPKAFARVAELRKQMIAAGLQIAAPCPHEEQCPLLLRGDWCHFAERLERTAEHRRIKGGSLGYEDEKFSYVAATRLSFPNRAGRIVRHPQIHSGYVELEVCPPEGLKKVTVTRSQKDSYRAARRSKWGDRRPAS